MNTLDSFVDCVDVQFGLLPQGRAGDASSQVDAA